MMEEAELLKIKKIHEKEKRKIAVDKKYKYLCCTMKLILFNFYFTNHYFSSVTTFCDIFYYQFFFVYEYNYYFILM